MRRSILGVVAGLVVAVAAGACAPPPIDPGTTTTSTSTSTSTTSSTSTTTTPNDIQTTVALVNVNEGGTATFGVRLATQPAATVAVSIASSNPGVATATPSSLAFTASNWDVYQTVTISGQQDANTANETAVINVAAPGVTTRTVTINVTDDDV